MIDKGYVEEEFDLEALKKAGEITAKAREYGKTLIVKGAKLLEVTEKIEKKIFELGGKLAFPVNISLDDTAAHYTAKIDDNTVFQDEVIKLDIGAHIDGWIGDSACTIDLSGRHQKLVEASEKALENAINIIKPGVTLGDIGKTVEETITSYGFQPVRNLSGHQIGNYVLHTGTTIPNFDTKDDTKIEPGMIFAIEPFATTGVGMIEEKGNAEIFSIEEFKPTRLQLVRKIMRHVENEYDELPFSLRMLANKFNENQVKLALRMLDKNETLKKYKPLIEQSQGLVSQTEHTIYVDHNWKVHVLTKA